MQAAFECSLKTLKTHAKLSLICSKAASASQLPGSRSTAATSSRSTAAIPASLSTLLVRVTHALLGHIVLSFERGEGKEGELVAWLVFGCSFINAGA